VAEFEPLGGQRRWQAHAGHPGRVDGRIELPPARRSRPPEWVARMGLLVIHWTTRTIQVGAW